MSKENSPRPGDFCPGEVVTAQALSGDTLEVASRLIGCRLCQRVEGGVSRWVIHEVEAYDGPDDRASHAYRGPTPRNAIMFGEAGYWYVYLCYGRHWMLNIVTGPAGYPAAVLIRGAGPWSGPGRLTRGLGIGPAWQGRAATPDCGLWLERAGALEDPPPTVRLPRVGVAYAGEDWAHRPYRWVESRAGRPGTPERRRMRLNREEG